MVDCFVSVFVGMCWPSISLTVSNDRHVTDVLWVLHELTDLLWMSVSIPFSLLFQMSMSIVDAYLFNGEAVRGILSAFVLLQLAPFATAVSGVPNTLSCLRTQEDSVASAWRYSLDHLCGIVLFFC